MLMGEGIGILCAGILSSAVVMWLKSKWLVLGTGQSGKARLEMRPRVHLLYFQETLICIIGKSSNVPFKYFLPVIPGFTFRRLHNIFPTLCVSY